MKETTGSIRIIRRYPILKAGIITILLMAIIGCQSTSSAPEEQTVPVAATESGSVQKPADEVDADGPITQDRVKIPFQLDNEEYQPLLEVSKEGFVIPGLKQKMIPQGMAYDPSRNWLVMSSYNMEKTKASVLSILDADSGKLLKSVQLVMQNGELYTGHAGGVAVSKKHAWVSSGGAVYRVPLEALEQAQDMDKVQFDGQINTDVRASFTAYHEGVLWIGEFAQGADYETNASHVMTTRDNQEHRAWIVGYRLDEATDHLPEEKQAGQKAIPDIVLSIQDRIQGLAFWNEWIVLSDSYGRNNESTKVFHLNPLALDEKAHSVVKIEGADIPLWFLDELNRVSSIDGPPMSQAIVPIGEELHILYESAADEYLTSGTYPLDTLLVLEKASVKLNK